MKTLLSAVVILLVGTLGLGAQGARKRVAVLDFDFTAVQSNARSSFGNADVGKAVTSLLIERLVSTGVYSVMERKALDSIIAEQNFSNSDRANPATAAKIGKLLGVDAMIVGSVTQLGQDDKNTNVTGILGSLGGKYGVGGFGTRNAKTNVTLTARLVSVETAEVLAVESAKGEASKTSAGVLGSGGSAVTGSALVDNNFANSLLTEAMCRAVNGLASQLDRNAQRLPTHTVVIDGLVADANGPSLILNVGSKAGVKVGDHYRVTRTSRTVTDPASGRVLRRVEETVGQVIITEVDEISATGKFDGSGSPKVGDHVKS